MLKLIIISLMTVLFGRCGNSLKQINYDQTSDSTLTILTYGLPDMTYLKAMDAVGKKYHLTHYAVAGCIVTSELLDSVEKENQKVYAILENKYGKKWKATFEKEIQEMITFQKKVVKLVQQQDFIRQKEAELSATQAWLDFQVHPDASTSVFDVKVLEWTQSSDDRLIYELSVDLKKQTVIVKQKYNVGEPQKFR